MVVGELNALLIARAVTKSTRVTDCHLGVFFCCSSVGGGGVVLLVCYLPTASHGGGSLLSEGGAPGHK